MSLAQRDYILRLIEQFAAALARIVARREQGDLAGATREVRESADRVFGPIARSLDELAPRGVAHMVQEPAKLAVYASLTAERAAIADAADCPDRAARLRARALALYLEAVERAPGSEICLGHIEELRLQVDDALLEPRHRAALARLGAT